MGGGSPPPGAWYPIPRLRARYSAWAKTASLPTEKPRRPRTGAEIQGAEVLGTKLRSLGGVDVEPGTDWHSHLGVAKFQHGFAPTSSRVAGNG